MDNFLMPFPLVAGCSALSSHCSDAIPSVRLPFDRMCHQALSQLPAAIVQGQQAEPAPNLKCHQCSFTVGLFPRTWQLGHRVRSPLLITQRKSTWFYFLSIALVSLWETDFRGPGVVPGVLASSPGLYGSFGGWRGGASCILCVNCRLTSASKCSGFLTEGKGWLPS